ncbi:MAG: hemin uptake protein HemP [Gammaproteobacteria bacterium]
MYKTIKLKREDSQYSDDAIHVNYILNGKKKITLRHAGKNYILQITSNNKLLLTK